MNWRKFSQGLFVSAILFIVMTVLGMVFAVLVNTCRCTASDGSWSFEPVRGNSFTGFLRDGKFEDTAHLLDKNTSFTITVIRALPLDLKMDYSGMIEVEYLGMWLPVGGPWSEVVTDVEADGRHFEGEVKILGVAVGFQGSLRADAKAIDLHVN